MNIIYKNLKPTAVNLQNVLELYILLQNFLPFRRIYIYLSFNEIRLSKVNFSVLWNQQLFNHLYLLLDKMSLFCFNKALST